MQDFKIFMGKKYFKNSNNVLSMIPISYLILIKKLGTNV